MKVSTSSPQNSSKTIRNEIEYTGCDIEIADIDRQTDR